MSYFNLLLMLANLVTPLFGLLLDKCGVSAGLTLVNVMARGNDQGRLFTHTTHFRSQLIKV